MPNIIDDRTANLNLPLPAISNPLSVDNGRLRDALAAIDTAVFGRPLAADVTTQINAAVAALIGGAPGALDTLKELADAINDDASFAATVTNALAAKAPLASPTFTGTPTVNGTALATTNKSTPIYLPTLASIDECRILTGTYAGGYLVAPAGYLNVYFAALGLLGVVEKRPTETKAFLDMVFANLVKASDGTRGSYTVYDVQGIQGTPSLKDPDSNDSYASVLNTLAYQYALASGDWAWYSANVTMLKNLAYFNIVVPLKPAGAAGAGMARTFQTSAWGPYYGICLTEDNCEVYEGMDALSKGCAAIGATADATYYANVRDGLGAAINNVNYGVWDQVNNRWFTSDQRPAFAGTFYADAVTQVFPEVYNVSSGDAATDRQRYDFGWVSLNAAAPQWESVKYDDFPWMILAYAAELRGSFDQAEQKMGSVRRINTRAQFTVNEAGWQGRVEKLASLRGYVPPTKAAVGLGSVDNTSDVNKPVSTAQQAAIATAQASLTATSTTSQAVGLGAKSITIELNKSLAVGQPISVASTASPANADYGTVTAYSPSTGALSYTANDISGSGTFAAWTVSVTGKSTLPGTAVTGLDGTELFAVDQPLNTKKKSTIQKILDWILARANTWTGAQTFNGAVTASAGVSVTGGALGYGPGAGGTVTQATSKGTAVTLNKICGQITMNNAALAAGASVIFTVNNNTITSYSDFVSIVPVALGSYRVEVSQVSPGFVDIRVTNVSAGALSDALTITFSITRVSTA
jgi:hypothetical protein